MAAPRQGLNPTTHSVGYTAKLVTVNSISADGTTAQTVDRQNTQAQVSMLVQRSKGPLPKPGETWLLTQDLGVWTFAAFVAKAPSDFASSPATGAPLIVVSAQPPASPAAGTLWMSTATSDELFQWSGTSWVPLQFGTQALADGAVTAAKIAPGTITSAQISPSAGITAGQVAFTVTDIGGTRIITGTSQPVNPQPGNIWINPANGNAMSIWDGNEWSPIPFGGGAIAPGGIGPGQINFTARDIGGLTTSVATVQPTSPIVGDLWFDGTAGFMLKQWTGSAWVPYQFGTSAIAAGSITAALIAANTITAAQIAAGSIDASRLVAGIISAGMVDGTTIKGAQFVAYGVNGEILIYSGSPASGNLIGAWSAVAGNDGTSSNFWTPGISVGATSEPQILLIPGLPGGGGSQISFPFNVGDDAGSAAILNQVNNAGQVNQFLSLAMLGPVNIYDPQLMQFWLTFATDSDDHTIKSSTILSDAFGNVYFAVTNPDGVSPAKYVGQPPPKAGPGYMTSFVPEYVNGAVLMQGPGSIQIVQKFSSPTTWTCPAGVTLISKVECEGPSGGGASGGGGGSGGGEYVAETSVAVTPGTAYALGVGTGGAPGAAGGFNSGHAASGPTTVTFDAVTLTAHPGQFGFANGTGGGGGQGSANSVHHPGGTGGSSPAGATGGGGGGGSGGPGGAGGNGGPSGGSGPSHPGAGGSAGAGGGAVGGGGGWGGGSPTVGGGGGSPGGGAGAGGYNSGAGASSAKAGGPGVNGRITLTYTMPGGTAMLASMASAAGTDTGGNAFPAGFQGPIVAVHPGTTPSVPETWQNLILGNSWGMQGGLYARYRLMPDNSVRINAKLSAGNLTNGIVIATLPAGYVPAFPQPVPVITENPGSVTAPALTPRAEVQTNGQIKIFNLPAGLTQCSINGSCPLD